MPPDSQLKTVEDLKGRKVAQFRGTNLQIATDRVLEKHGLPKRTSASSTSTRIPSRPRSCRAMSRLPSAARNISTSPSAAGSRSSTRQERRPDPRAQLRALVTAEFEKAHPEFTAKVVRAFVKTERFGSDEANRQAVFELWSKAGLPVESFEADFKDEPLAHRLSPVVDDFIIARYKDQAERAKVYGLIKKDVDIDSWFETKYLKQALVDLKLENYWPTFDAKGQKVTDGDVEHTKPASK